MIYLAIYILYGIHIKIQPPETRIGPFHRARRGDRTGRAAPQRTHRGLSISPRIPNWQITNPNQLRCPLDNRTHFSTRLPHHPLAVVSPRARSAVVCPYRCTACAHAPWHACEIRDLARSAKRILAAAPHTPTPCIQDAGSTEQILRGKEPPIEAHTPDLAARFAWRGSCVHPQR